MSFSQGNRFHSFVTLRAFGIGIQDIGLHVDFCLFITVFALIPTNTGFYFHFVSFHVGGYGLTLLHVDRIVNLLPPTIVFVSVNETSDFRFNLGPAYQKKDEKDHEKNEPDDIFRVIHPKLVCLTFEFRPINDDRLLNHD